MFGKFTSPKFSQQNQITQMFQLQISDVQRPFPSWLVVSNMNFICHFIYGMSSFPLTNTVFFKMVRTTNQKAMAKVQKQHESLSDPTKLMLEPSRRGQHAEIWCKSALPGKQLPFFDMKLYELAGGLELVSHILGIIIPTDFHIFQMGWNHQPLNIWRILGLLKTTTCETRSQNWIWRLWIPKVNQQAKEAVAPLRHLHFVPIL